jgi:hypothetical protein
MLKTIRAYSSTANKRMQSDAGKAGAADAGR